MGGWTLLEVDKAAERFKIRQSLEALALGLPQGLGLPAPNAGPSVGMPLISLVGAQCRPGGLTCPSTVYAPSSYEACLLRYPRKPARTGEVWRKERQLMARA